MGWLLHIFTEPGYLGPTKASEQGKALYLAHTICPVSHFSGDVKALIQPTLQIRNDYTFVYWCFDLELHMNENGAQLQQP